MSLKQLLDDLDIHRDSLAEVVVHILSLVHFVFPFDQEQKLNDVSYDKVHGELANESHNNSHDSSQLRNHITDLDIGESELHLGVVKSKTHLDWELLLALVLLISRLSRSHLIFRLHDGNSLLDVIELQ